MGVPSRFAIEYPQRALELIRSFEKHARHSNLVGSFGLLAASAVLTIPYERMQARHFLHDKDEDQDLANQLKVLTKDRFLEAPFWAGRKPGRWRQSRIMATVDQVDKWQNEKGLPSLSDDANIIQTKTADKVIRVIRNALSHGNIIYLNKNDQEISGSTMVSMAFLSRYEETEEQRRVSTTYRVVVTTEDEFLQFIKDWAFWVGNIQPSHSISAAA